MNELIVTHADMRALGYCNRGARAWFARHQFDWPRFLEEGLPAADLLATGDQLAHAVVEVASQRTQTGGDDGRQ
jgi:hypothetical protein